MCESWTSCSVLTSTTATSAPSIFYPTQHGAPSRCKHTHTHTVTFSLFTEIKYNINRHLLLLVFAQVMSFTDEFRGLDRDIEGSPKRWKKLVESECPEKEKFPQEWKGKSSLQKLIMMRALRPDRMTYALRCSGVLSFFCILLVVLAFGPLSTCL